MISFIQKNQTMTLEFQMSWPMMLVIIYVFWISDINKFLKVFQPVKVEFKFDGIVLNDINGYYLVLLNNV